MTTPGAPDPRFEDAAAAAPPPADVPADPSFAELPSWEDYESLLERGGEPAGADIDPYAPIDPEPERATPRSTEPGEQSPFGWIDNGAPRTSKDQQQPRSPTPHPLDSDLTWQRTRDADPRAAADQRQMVFGLLRALAFLAFFLAQILRRR